MRSKYHAPKVHITRRKANITENDKFLSKLVVFWCGRQDMKAKTRYARYRGEVSFVGFEAFARRTSRQIRRVHRHTKKKRGTRPLFFLSMGYKKDIIGILQMNSNSHLTVSF